MNASVIGIGILFQEFGSILAIGKGWLCFVIPSIQLANPISF